MLRKEELDDLLAIIDEYEEQSREATSTSSTPFATIDISLGLCGVEDLPEGIGLRLNDGRLIHIKDHHTQDCCEQVYADWNYILDFIATDEPDWSQFTSASLSMVEDAGFLISFLGDSDKTSFFVPCYNEQDGYYSSDLALIVDGVEYDISSCTKDLGSLL